MRTMVMMLWRVTVVVRVSMRFMVLTLVAGYITLALWMVMLLRCRLDREFKMLLNLLQLLQTATVSLLLLQRPPTVADNPIDARQPLVNVRMATVAAVAGQMFYNHGAHLVQFLHHIQNQLVLD